MIQRNAFHRFMILFAGVLSLLVLSGCSGSGLTTVPIEIDPQAAAQLAMDAYDINGDGQLDAEELMACPALVDAGSRVDSNGDGAVSADEISQRLQGYQSLSEFIGADVYVMENRRPVSDAEVVFEPEPFMGESYPTYRGKTDQDGTVVLLSEPRTPGFPLGFYRVRISKIENGKEVLAEKYNTNTTLGREIADDTPSPNRISFDL